MHYYVVIRSCTEVKLVGHTSLLSRSLAYRDPLESVQHCFLMQCPRLHGNFPRPNKKKHKGGTGHVRFYFGGKRGEHNKEAQFVTQSSRGGSAGRAANKRTKNARELNFTGGGGMQSTGARFRNGNEFPSPTVRTTSSPSIAPQKSASSDRSQGQRSIYGVTEKTNKQTKNE